MENETNSNDEFNSSKILIPGKTKITVFTTARAGNGNVRHGGIFQDRDENDLFIYDLTQKEIRIINRKVIAHISIDGYIDDKLNLGDEDNGTD